MQGAYSQSDHEPSSREHDDDNDELVHKFQVLGVNLHEDDVCTWLESDSNDPGFQLMTDEEICSHVMSGEPSEDESDAEEAVSQPTCPVSNSQAAHMLEKCLTWLEHQPEANQYNVCTLRGLRALAARKRGLSMRQMTITECYSDT